MMTQDTDISGVVHRITFQSKDTGFTVATIKRPGDEETVIVGTLPALQAGESLRCSGSWAMHPVHGMQFSVKSSEIVLPEGTAAIELYLKSGAIKGIGPVFAKRIVQCFGDKTLEIIDADPSRLREVPGLGRSRKETLIQSWKDQQALRHVMLFLYSVGISSTMAQKIYKQYGEDAVAVIKENPYQLSSDVWGIGFKIADQIAMDCEIAKDSPHRVQAGISYVLSQVSLEGHICYPEDKLLERSQGLLMLDQDLVKDGLETLVYEGRVTREVMAGDRPFIWHKALYLSETGIVTELQRLHDANRFLDLNCEDLDFKDFETRLGIALSESQTEALTLAIQEKILLLTGGPGTGKTTLTQAILMAFSETNAKILLAAPTGRAAKRLSEVTGFRASTIHSMLSYDFREGGFQYHHQNPLKCDLLIVDELSMVDSTLMHSLLKAIPSHATVLMVGDPHQLPSMGPGTVLRDLIASKAIPTVSLQTIFRQAEGSMIIKNAHAIQSGVFPDISVRKEGDFFFLKEPETDRIKETILGLVTTRLPKAYGLDPLTDIQVMTPQNRGPIGTEILNQVLQHTLNPQSEELELMGGSFRVQDKVMQCRNNYQKGVFNGDLGYVTSINQEEQMMSVRFDEQEIEYDFSDLDELKLAYAVTVHKFQGSECPCIIMPVHMAHYKLLYRNLVYTGITRGKKLVILVGSQEALEMAISREDVSRRHTGLASFLSKASE